MYLLAVLFLIAMSRLLNATIAIISASYLFSLGALALGGSRASILSAALITLVQKLTTDSLGPCFRSCMLIIAVQAVHAGACANKNASLNYW